MPQQDALTIVAEVDTSRVDSLVQLLEKMRVDPGRNNVLPFAALSECHFGRVVLLTAASDHAGRRTAPQLLVVSDCDGPASAHLDALIEAAGRGIDRLFGHCVGYPAPPISGEARRAFLESKRVPVQANYVHWRGRTAEQIRNEAELRHELQRFLDSQTWNGQSALETLRRVRAHLEGDANWSWALQAAPDQDVLSSVSEALRGTAALLGFAALSPVLLPAFLALLLIVRRQELQDARDSARPSPELLRELTRVEDRFAHNSFTAVGFVKPGLARRAVVASVLPVIGWAARYLFARGSLAGVRTIHFARWITLDGGRRVAFASNYDGSLESYNNDFIDLVAYGLNLIFSNGYGYPETAWLVLGGASREQEFKDYLRCHQIPTPVWYSAYPDLTAVNIERNAELRAGLRADARADVRADMNEAQARQWLRLLC